MQVEAQERCGLYRGQGSEPTAVIMGLAANVCFPHVEPEAISVTADYSRIGSSPGATFWPKLPGTSLLLSCSGRSNSVVSSTNGAPHVLGDRLLEVVSL